MKTLSRSEETILLTILKLGEGAYGVSIREQIYQDTGQKWSFASIYTPLDKMKRKGFVSKIKGNPLPERGGKSRYFYEVTPSGIQSLVELRESQQKIWSGIPDTTLELNGKK